MTGFYGDLGWRLGSGFKVQDERFWSVLEGVGSRYSVQTVNSLGYWGGMGLVVVTSMVLVAG